MFSKNSPVKFMMAEDAQKEVNGPRISELLDLVKKTHPAALTIVMGACMDRITEEAGDGITLVLRNKWFVGPLGKMVMEKDEHEGKSYTQLNIGQPTLTGMPKKDPLGGCVELGKAGDKLDMSKLLKMKEVDNMGKQYYNNDKGELCEHGAPEEAPAEPVDEPVDEDFDDLLDMDPEEDEDDE